MNNKQFKRELERAEQIEIRRTYKVIKESQRLRKAISNALLKRDKALVNDVYKRYK